MGPGYYPALIIGLIGSSVIHLSQGLLKLAHRPGQGKIDLEICQAAREGLRIGSLRAKA